MNRVLSKVVGGMVMPTTSQRKRSTVRRGDEGAYGPAVGTIRCPKCGDLFYTTPEQSGAEAFDLHFWTQPVGGRCEVNLADKTPSDLLVSSHENGSAHPSPNVTAKRALTAAERKAKQRARERAVNLNKVLHGRQGVPSK